VYKRQRLQILIQRLPILKLGIKVMTRQEKAFLDLVSRAEGTYGISNNGYDVLINDGQIQGQSRIIKDWTEDTTITHGLNTWYVKAVNSTAAGRYQFIGKTWMGMNSNQNVPMTKDNQDSTALRLLQNKLGLTYTSPINSVSDMQIIVDKLKTTWASFGVISATTLFNWYKIAYAKY
jgi:muramidase (phage lysozyme)